MGGHFECSFEFQPGWVDLTLSEGTQSEAKSLALQMIGSLNPLGHVIEKRAVFNSLVERAVDLNEDHPTLAAVYYTEEGEPLVNLVVDSYSDEGVPRPSPKEVQPLLLEWSNAKAVGEPEISYLDLAAGPAVRVQSMLQAKRLLGLGRKLAEFIKYAVFPPGMQSVIVVTVTWQNIALTEGITALADEAVRSMRITPLTAEGTPARSEGCR